MAPTQDKDREIERLTSENRELRAGLKEMRDMLQDFKPDDDRSDGLIGLAFHTWQQAEGRVMLLACALFLRMWLYVNHENFWPNNVGCGLAALVLFFKWNEQEYRDNGFIQLLMKWALFGAGIYATALIFFRGDLWWAGLTLLASALLTISKLTQRLAARIGELVEQIMTIPILVWAKGWLL